MFLSLSPSVHIRVGAHASRLLFRRLLQLSNAPMHLILMRFRRYFRPDDHSCVLLCEPYERMESRVISVSEYEREDEAQDVSVARELKILHANMIQEKELQLRGILKRGGTTSEKDLVYCTVREARLDESLTSAGKHKM